MGSPDYGAPAPQTPITVTPETDADIATPKTATDQPDIATTGENAPVDGAAVSDDLAKAGVSDPNAGE